MMIIMAGIVHAGGRQTAGLIKDGVLKIGIEHHETAGKKPAEFFMRLGREIAGKLKLDPEFTEAAAGGIFAGLESGRYDCIISAAEMTPERIAAYSFSKPFLANSMVIILLKDSPYRINNPDGLAGFGVSYLAGSSAKRFLTGLAANGLRYTPYEYDKIAHCFDELKLGRTDAIVTDFISAADYLAAADSPFRVAWQGEAGYMIGICMKKGNESLTAAVNRALDELYNGKILSNLSMEAFGTDLAGAAR